MNLESGPEKVLLAMPRGFCAGVDRTITGAMQFIQEVRSQNPNEPVYFFHEPIHNQIVIQQFKALGGEIVNNMNDIPDGAPVYISAHGSSPEVREQAEEKGLIVNDATCPLVEAPHQRAKRLAKMGYSMFYIGHEGHDEAVGVLGEAPEQMFLIETVEDIYKYNPNIEKLAYLTQTTLSQDDTLKIEEALKARFPGIVGPPSSDICYATLNRQQAVKALVTRGSELVIVVGSQNSSNSKRLAEVALAAGARNSYLIDDASELEWSWFFNTRLVGLTSGASAPEKNVQEVLKHFQEHGVRKFEEVRPVNYKDETNIHFTPVKISI